MGIHDGHRKRMKGEFLARPDSFPDHKLLEILLFYANPRSDTNPTAHALMDRFGSLTNALDASPDELCQVPGVGEHAAVLLKLVKELGRRYLIVHTGNSDIITSTEQFVQQLRPYFYGLRSERLCLLCLDAKDKLLGVRVVCEGNIDRIDLAPRDIVTAVLSLGARKVVLAHNHPSGVSTPSYSDQIVTRSLRTLLSDLDIQVIDHLIFGTEDAISMAENIRGDSRRISLQSN